jgi:hypothetical protein
LIVREVRSTRRPATSSLPIGCQLSAGGHKYYLYARLPKAHVQCRVREQAVSPIDNCLLMRAVLYQCPNFVCFNLTATAHRVAGLCAVVVVECGSPRRASGLSAANFNSLFKRQKKSLAFSNPSRFMNATNTSSL